MNDIQRARGAFKGRNAGTRFGDMVWAVATDQSGSDGAYAQTQKALVEIDRVLGELGTDKTRLLNVTIHLTDIALKPEMERAWLEWIGDAPEHWPQRACVQSGLEGAAVVEIIVIAAAP